MIITLDVLPSIEYLYHVDQMMPFGSMESTEITMKINSKSIYAARAIRILQGDTVFIGMLGGVAGRYAKHYMDTGKIKSEIIWSQWQSPHKITIIDKESNHTIIKKLPDQIHEKDIIKLKRKFRACIRRGTTLVLDGNLANEIPSNTYTELIEEAKKYNLKTVLTTANNSLILASLENPPYSIMFTKEQLEKMDIDTSSMETIVRELIPYLDKGVHYIGVDMYNLGGLLLSKSKFCYMEPIAQVTQPWLDECSAAFLGAFAVGIDRKYEQEKIAKLAMASALAVQIEKGIYNKNNIDRLLKKVKVREVKICKQQKNQ